MSFTVGDIPGRDAVWLVEIAGATPIRLSNRPWAGEPGDATWPNTPFQPRLAAPVAISESITPRPIGARRTITAGELQIYNTDARFDFLRATWNYSNNTVDVYRGPYREGIRAPSSSFVRMARFRTTGSWYGGAILKANIGGAQLDLTGAACTVYDGTAGLGGGTANVGKNRPRCYGTCLNVEPVLIDSALLIYQFHDGAVAGVSAVRDRGVALTFGGDFATYAALAAAGVAAGTWYSCIAAGVIRIGALPAGTLTLDCTGDSAAGTGGYSNTLAGMVRKVLEGPGALATTDWLNTGFSVWSTGPAGLVLRGGTVADAMDRLAASAAGWWGADALGRIVGGLAVTPSTVPLAGTLRVLAARPDQAEPAPPIWRIRCAYDVMETLQASADLAATVTAANRERYGGRRFAAAEDTFVKSNFPAAIDLDPLACLFTTLSDAQALADRLLLLHGVPRQTWEVELGRVETTLAIGQAWNVDSTLAPQLAGQQWVVIGRALRGETMTVTLWG